MSNTPIKEARIKVPENTNEMKRAVHDCAQRWLNWLLSTDDNKFALFNGEKPFSVFYRELREQLGVFPYGEKLPDYEVKDLFHADNAWHDIVRFSEILNSLNDYKLVAFITAYKMKTVRNRVTAPEYRDFFIVGFERLICLTE